MANNDKHLTPKQAAELLHVSPVTIRYWAKKGDLAFITTPGGHRRFKLTDIEALQSAKPLTSSQLSCILIVEDNKLHADLLIEFIKLAKPSYHVVVAENGFQAGTFVQTAKPTLIFLDIVIPELDGYSVCKQLKSDPSTQHIPIIAMSGQSNSATIVKIAKAGADDFLDKPINRNIFNKLLDKYLP